MGIFQLNNRNRQKPKNFNATTSYCIILTHFQALHLAAAEGHIECVKFLINVAKVNCHVADRWGHTPIDEARKFGHEEVVKLMETKCMKD